MKKTLMCIVCAVMVLALAPGAWADEVENGGGCVTLQELVNAPQATDAAIAVVFGRTKTDKVTVCDPNEPSGQGTSVTCQDHYKTTGSYTCTSGTPKSPSCSVKGSCNIQPPGSGTGTKCECSHWCVTSTTPTEPEPL
jgi:hypothetical protein